MTTADCCFNE